MALAALILIDDDGPSENAVVLGGLGWGAFLLRQAVRAGATHLVVVAARVPSALVAAIDAVRREGASAALVRDAAAAGDLFHPDERVLLLTGNTAVAPAALATLIGTTSSPRSLALLCLPEDADGKGYERIDATACWVGAALIDGALVRASAATVGDWDMGSMLLRAAVQQRATRIVLTPDAVEGGLFDGINAPDDGWGTRWLVAPTARRFAPYLGRYAVPYAGIAPILAGATAVASLALALVGWVTAAFALVLVGMIVAAIGARVATAYGLRRIALAQWLQASAVMALLAASIASGASALVVGALAVVAFGLLLVRLPPGAPRWRADVPGQALLLLLGSAAGVDGFAVALALAALHGFASVAVGQARLAGS